MMHAKATMLSLRHYHICTLVIAGGLVWLTLGFPTRYITSNMFQTQYASKLPSPSCAKVKESETLSSYLIRSGIYSRRTNLSGAAREGKPPRNNISCPLFVTMGDGFYLPDIRNFHFQLRQYRLENNLVTICLDDECVKATRTKAKDLSVWCGFVNASVGQVKVITFCYS
jgi:hypothetical protein